MVKSKNLTMTKFIYTFCNMYEKYKNNNINYTKNIAVGYKFLLYLCFNNNHNNKINK